MGGGLEHCGWVARLVTVLWIEGNWNSKRKNGFLKENFGTCYEHHTPPHILPPQNTLLLTFPSFHTFDCEKAKRFFDLRLLFPADFVLLGEFRLSGFWLRCTCACACVGRLFTFAFGCCCGTSALLGRLEIQSQLTSILYKARGGVDDVERGGSESLTMRK